MERDPPCEARREERLESGLQLAPLHGHRERGWRSGVVTTLEYPGHFLVKRVAHAGTIRLQDRLLFLANALKEHPVGLEERDDGVWSLYLGSVLLGTIDERSMKVYG